MSNDTNGPMLANREKDVLVALSKAANTDELLEAILRKAESIASADGGTLYLLTGEESDTHLEFAVVHNETLNLYQGGVSGEPIKMKPVPLYQQDGNPNYANVASYTALTKKLSNIEDAYHNKDFDFSGTKLFDTRTGYRSKSFLTVPLLNHEDKVIGVLQLINAKDTKTGDAVPFSRGVEPIIYALSYYAAIALENKILIEEHKQLLDAFIRAIAQAIDAKSSHTAHHCQRVPMLAELLTQAVCADKEKFASFNLDEDGWYELRVAAWMHDCGKLATPDSVLDKATKLHTMRDGMEAINARFTALRHQTELMYYRDLSSRSEKEGQLKKELDTALLGIEEDRKLVEKTNKGGEALSSEVKERIQMIARGTWRDHNGDTQPLLTEEDVHNLMVERGTLTDEERQIINNHISVTIDMLESLPFPKKLQRVPEYAGGHHEKMDGSGFPKGLTREQMSIPARIMAIADIFEALTSQDRPYKDPMPISVALGILKNMRDSNHIDADLYHVFVQDRVWQRYGKAALAPAQIDVEDPSPYM
jgi:HD-GYP domain-containing protein (c-di-GMP phosphodiesterase class II)